MEAFPNLNDKELNEKYALISHSIQLGNISASKKYTNILKTNGIETNNFPKKRNLMTLTTLSLR